MDDCMVLVVTHKLFDDSIVPDGYRIIKVGNKISDDEASRRGYLTDDTGDNIAAQNPFYCELTAQYWAWKNLDKSVMYIGICHYRRYFFDYKKTSETKKDDILSRKRIEELLKKYKIIMSYPTIKLPGYGSLYRKLPKERQDKHWLIIEEIINEYYPEMSDSFYRVMYGRYTIWGNMLITRRDLFDSYCEWLFDVLEKYDKRIEEKGETRIPRVDGFLSEHLLLMWVQHTLGKKEIYHLEVRNTETDAFVDYQDSIKGKFVRFVRKNRILLNLARNIRICGLMISRRDKNR